MLTRAEKRTKLNRRLFLLLVSLAAIGIRCFGVFFESSDYINCLVPWAMQLKEAGPGIEALKNYQGDYTLPYVFLLWILLKLPIPFAWGIRLMHMAFDFLAAFFAGKIAEVVSPEKGRNFYIGYSVVLLLPTVFLNGSYWAQCDVIYTAFLLGAVFFLLKGRYFVMMSLIGVAFAFKLQTIFIFPFVVLYYWVSRKMSILHFACIPLSMIMVNIPAFLAGIGLAEVFKAYLAQSGGYPWLYYFYPNLWFFFQASPYYMFSSGAILLTLVALLIFVVLVIQKKVEITKDRILPILLWTAYTMVFFMPHMHERYGFLAEMLAVILAVSDRKKIWLALGMFISIFPKYLDALYLIEINKVFQGSLAVINTIVYLTFTCFLWKELFGIRSEKINV